ncbi:MAG: hypothetical protein AAF702_03655 [Chloroflexota bacterium]
MSDSQWRQKGGSLSHKNASKEFGLTEAELFEAIRAGKLHYRQNYAHGNPYFKLLRSEVAALAYELRGEKGMEEQKIEHELTQVNREINSLKRKLSALEKRKIELLKHQNNE